VVRRYSHVSSFRDDDVVVVVCARTYTGTSPAPDFLLDIQKQIFSLLYPEVKKFFPDLSPAQGNLRYIKVS
jgi:hypothetical protein